jgi:serine/threonine protein kinase/tetratricopeptide (TPR) repeat protein
VATTPAKRACPACGALLAEASELCPVCALRLAVETQSESVSDASSELRFEHYTVLKNAEGKRFELGRGAMGVTYKAFDVHLQRPAALKIINRQLFGNESARARFVREARAAASVRHQNVASVFHIGESGGNYYYAMEFVEGESLEALIRRSGCHGTDLGLDIAEQAAAGLAAIEKQHLVHRDIKPSNIMVSLQDGKLETVKIIDLGLAKGVAEENTLSTVGAFVGTPAYASPEQFAGIATDIRSDLYSLGVTLWEMLSGKLPFSGSSAELMYQHQHAEPPIEKLKSLPAPIIALLQVLLAKDPNQRFRSPAQLQQALTRVRGAIGSGLRLTADELRSTGDGVTENLSKGKPRNQPVRWVLGIGLCLAGGLIAWFFFFGHAGFLSNQRVTQAVPTEKSVAVLPFESLSESKTDAYFADGVQDEILNNLAKIAQLKVISRTSVMQYRADTKRDLRQIANALGVANVLEGTVRRDGNHVRVSTELVDARSDNTIWADSYDRDLTDIFAIQSEVAQTIASKLTATLSPEEKKRIEAKPTNSLEAYDLYLRAKELFVSMRVSMSLGNVEKPLVDAIGFLEQAVRLDPKFTLAYCALAFAHDSLFFLYDFTPEQRALADASVNSALGLQPDLPEVHLAYASHLYLIYRDYERARVQLAIARRGLPNYAEVIALGARIDRRQGQFEKAIVEFNEAITRDPRNIVSMQELADTFYYTRQFRAAEQAFDRVIDLRPDLPILKVRKPLYVTFYETGDDAAVRSAIATLPASMSEDRGVLSLRLMLALVNRDWSEARELIEKMKGGEDEGWFAYGDYPVPVGCYSIMLARVQGERPGPKSDFVEAREQLNQKIQNSAGNAVNACLLSDLAVVDALLGQKEAAVAEAKRAIEMLPISRDVFDGPGIVMNLAVVYAWTDEFDLAFAALTPLIKMPFGIFYGRLKGDPYWEPLRKDPRFDKLLAELAPRD